jgi:hypothetical protein
MGKKQNFMGKKQNLKGTKTELKIKSSVFIRFYFSVISSFELLNFEVSGNFLIFAGKTNN